MKKLRVPKKKSAATYRHASHQDRRVTLGIALVLLGVLIVINLLTMSLSYNVEPVQGADVNQTR